jgi:hypothetical protein
MPVSTEERFDPMKVGAVGRRAWILPLAASVLCLLMFHAVGSAFLGGYRTVAGSLLLPVSQHMECLSLWTVIGSAAVCFLAVALWRLPQTVLEKLRLTVTNGSDRAWVLCACAAALLIPELLRFAVLQGSPLTDDETCYEFMARLLASGRLRAVSPPAKLFYDHTFMINDGHFYSQYFIGWPLVMVPFLWLGIGEIANAVCCAITVPALYAILKRVAGPAWARCGLVLYLFSPLLMIGAATQLSHTSCVMVLTWMIAVFLRIKDGGAPWGVHAAYFALFCLAFLIRPMAALGIGVPFMVDWLLVLRREPWRHRMIAFASGALVSALGAFVFLWINYAQTGSPFMPAYQRYVAYSIENGCRFSYLPSVEYARELQVVGMHFANPLVPLAMLGTAAFRMNFALFGWPFCLLFVPFGVAARRAPLFAWSLLSFVAVHFFISDVGVDLFGPVHYTETAVPLLVLTVVGLAHLAERFRGSPVGGGVPFPCHLALALILVSFVGYIPIRLSMLAEIGTHVARPFRDVEAATVDAGPVVVFSSLPFAPLISAESPPHFVFYPPVNDPDLKNRVLWVNHISVADDRRFMQFHPERKGFVFVWRRSGDSALLPLDRLKPGDVPKGRFGGNNEGPDWATIEKEVREGAP